MDWLTNGIWAEHIQIAQHIARGIGVTLQYTVLSVILGFLFSLVLTFLRYTRFAFISKFYVSVFRGVPLLVQLSIIYFALPIKLDIFPAALLAFSLNSAAYVTEILKSGIQAIDIGQFEAAKALGIPTFLMWKDIIFPQVLRNVVPALFNELTAMVKETAIVSYFGSKDIMKRASEITQEHYIYMEPLLIAGIYYYALVSLLSMLTKIIERRYDLR